MSSNGIDFVDKNNAGGVFLSLLKQITHPAGADADKHLDKIRTADGEKGNVGFAGNGPRQQGLPRTRRPHQKNALGDSPSEFLEFLGFFQELDDLRQLFLRFLYSGDILESHLLLLARQQARAAFAERKSFVPAALHLAHEENPEADQKDERQPGRKENIHE